MHQVGLDTTCHRLKQVKQYGTNNLTQCSSTDFTAFSGGMLHFAFCVANKNRLFDLRDPDCMLKISTQSAEGVYKVNTDNKTQRTARKSIKNSDGNRCQIVYAVLFDLFFCVTSNVGVMFSEADSDCLSIVGTALTHQKHT